MVRIEETIPVTEAGWEEVYVVDGVVVENYVKLKTGEEISPLPGVRLS